MNMYVIAALTGVTIASFSQILLKKSSTRTYPSWIREYLNPFVICGYGLMFMAMLFSTFAYSGLDYTNVPLLESCGYITVMVLSYFFFKEKITLRKVAGMTIILIGIAVYYLGGI
jgi:drug/metabolite transporter (DMT)-like permease